MTDGLDRTFHQVLDLCDGQATTPQVNDRVAVRANRTKILHGINDPFPSCLCQRIQMMNMNEPGRIRSV